MTEIPIPQSAAEVDAAWLSQVLEPQLGARVASIDKQRIAEGVGIMGTVERIAIEYADEAPGAPRSVICKTPTDVESFRAVAMMLGLFEREHRFYQQLAPSLNLPLPRVYHSAGDAERARYVLVLEDVPGRPGDQVEHRSLDDIRLALEHIAPLHAAYWNAPIQKRLPWVPTIALPAYAGLLEASFHAGLEPFQHKQGSDIPTFSPELNDIARRFDANHGWFLAEELKHPMTLVHADYRIDNLLFDAGPDRPLVILDWQLIGHFNPLLDAAYLLAGSLPIELRRTHQDELLGHYHDALCRAGVTGFDFDACRELYRRAALLLIYYMVVGQEQGSRDDLANERGERLMDIIFERYAAAILDADAGALLPK